MKTGLDGVLSGRQESNCAPGCAGYGPAHKHWLTQHAHKLVRDIPEKEYSGVDEPELLCESLEAYNLSDVFSLDEPPAFGTRITDGMRMLQRSER